MAWFLLVAFITVPFVVVACEAFITIKTRSKTHQFLASPVASFRILVPIWGNIKYLENVDFLAPYCDKVTLCTTGDESDEFYADITKLQKKFGFEVYIDPPVNTKKGTSTAVRSTSGTIRDRIVRNALATIEEEYVVPLDADSTTVENISLLVGELVRQNYDIASIKIVPRNTDSILAKLQVFEYELAMRLRFLAPWLISGACHPAKTKVLHDIMMRHSLFFQGNDVETGLLAKTLKYNVGHLPFHVLTTVPDKIKPWFRQRLAWAGGEFRLFVVNFKFILRHPFFWIYGTFITIFFFPLRWLALSGINTSLFLLILLYLFLAVFIHWKNLNWYILLLPFYTLFVSVIMVPLGIYWYFYMALKDKNAGIIDATRMYEN
jgi:hypothetical protein